MNDILTQVIAHMLWPTNVTCLVVPCMFPACHQKPRRSSLLKPHMFDQSWQLTVCRASSEVPTLNGPSRPQHLPHLRHNLGRAELGCGGSAHGRLYMHTSPGLDWLRSAAVPLACNAVPFHGIEPAATLMTSPGLQSCQIPYPTLAP